ncbi:MAG: UbiA family prenyltransferase, partial [Microbacteriaceae bacterium]|nr:UbiA family prenyltransferase [Microbacteriaceae bacterium]
MARGVRAIIGAAHAGPSFVVTLVMVLLAHVSGLEPWRVLVLGVIMATNQFSIGWSNDAIDAARDTDAERSDKPVVRGDVGLRTIMGLAVGAAATALVLSLVVGPACALAHLVALGAGWSYNAGLKRTVLATACYA